MCFFVLPHYSFWDTKTKLIFSHMVNVFSINIFSICYINLSAIFLTILMSFLPTHSVYQCPYKRLALRIEHYILLMYLFVVVFWSSNKSLGFHFPWSKTSLVRFCPTFPWFSLKSLLFTCWMAVLHRALLLASWCPQCICFSEIHSSNSWAQQLYLQAGNSQIPVSSSAPDLSKPNAQGKLQVDIP